MSAAANIERKFVEVCNKIVGVVNKFVHDVGVKQEISNGDYKESDYFDEKKRKKAEINTLCATDFKNYIEA